MKNILKKTVPLLLVIFLLAGCGARKSVVTERAVEVEEPAVAYSTSGANGYVRDFAADEEAPAEAKEAGGTAALPTGRKIIRNADLSIQTREYDGFMTGLEQRVAAAGGYIESSYANGTGLSGKKKLRSAELTVRIPSENLDTFMDGVCEAGSVVSKNVYTNDVTANYVDTEARLNALRTERDTLMGLLEKAEKMEDIILIYERISDVTYEIESYESRLRTWDDQISYSTVTISVSEVARETVIVKETTGEEIQRRFSENWDDLCEGFRLFFIWFVSDLPSILLFLLFVFVLVMIVRAIVKRIRRKRAARKAAAAQARADAAQTPPAGEKK